MSPVMYEPSKVPTREQPTQLGNEARTLAARAAVKRQQAFEQREEERRNEQGADP
jgi:hypothetical protein